MVKAFRILLIVSRCGYIVQPIRCRPIILGWDTNRFRHGKIKFSQCSRLMKRKWWIDRPKQCIICLECKEGREHRAPEKSFLFALLLGCALCFPALAESVDRVLLVGCDNFVSQVSTAPSSANNVTQMMSVLSGGDLDPVTMVTRRNDLYSKEALERLILETFADADEDDVSFFYISTHGLWKQGQANGSMTLLLSDGVREDGITASELKETFDQIKGTKVLIVDACHSGAMLGKGVHPPLTTCLWARITR